MLRLGARFYFISDKNRNVHEVVKPDLKKPQYQKMNGEKYAWAFSRVATADREVMFLRQTILMPGDECFLQDLAEGCTVSAQGRTFEIMEFFGTEVKLKEGIKRIFSHALTTVTLISLPKQAEA